MSRVRFNKSVNFKNTIIMLHDVRVIVIQEPEKTLSFKYADKSEINVDFPTDEDLRDALVLLGKIDDPEWRKTNTLGDLL